jgi:putative transposase
MIHQLIRQLQKEAIPVQHSCRVLEVSRSGFYEAQHRSAKPVVCKASVHLKAAFISSHQSYGSRRLVTAMANEGFRIGRYKVRSLMRKAALSRSGSANSFTRQIANTTCRSPQMC